MPQRLVCWLFLALLVSCAAAPEPAQQTDASACPCEAEGLPQKASGTADEMEQLARTDPVAFLERSLRRCEDDVRSYCGILEKRERAGKKLLPPEKVRFWFQEKPFSVRMDWVEGAGLASRTAYVEGKNNGKLLVVGSGWRVVGGVVERDPAGYDAKGSARYPITEFGIRIGTERTLAAWKRARERGDLDVRFLGTVTEPEGGNRPCWKLRRVGYVRPEDDGITESTFWFDRETWLQVGSYLTGEGGRLIGYYYFRDLEFNPSIPAATFTRDGLWKR